MIDLQLLGVRMRNVAAAARDGDEPALRVELKLLSLDAKLLAGRTPLLPASRVARRQLIAAEADRTRTAAF